MSTNSSDSPDETMLTQQSIGTSTAVKSNEQKRLETSKLMIENDIKLHIDYMLSEIEASDDLESLNEMKEDIRAMQQKLEFIIFELLNFVELDEQDQMSRDFIRLKIDIKRTFTLIRKQVKEVNTRNQQEMTASEPDSMKTIVHDDNIMLHQQQQPRLNFVFDDSVTEQTHSFNSASAPAGSSFAVSSSCTAPGGSTYNGHTTSSFLRFSTAPYSTSQPSFVSVPVGYLSTNVTSLCQNYPNPSNPSTFSSFSQPIVSQMPQFSGQSVLICTCFQKSVPKLNADHFNGDPLSWMKWFSTFQATIDRSPMISPEKMIHLQSLLNGEAKALVDGYGCNGDLYASAINRLQEHSGNPKRIVNAFLEKLSSFKAPNLAHPESYTQFSCFLLTMVDTFSQQGFIHDLHSTTNLNVALAKLPNPVRLEWNKFVLKKNYQQPSRQTLSEWLLNFSKACNDLNSIIHVTQNNFKTPGKPTFLADIITLPMARKIVTRGNFETT